MSAPLPQLAARPPPMLCSTARGPRTGRHQRGASVWPRKALMGAAAPSSAAGLLSMWPAVPEAGRSALGGLPSGEEQWTGWESRRTGMPMAPSSCSWREGGGEERGGGGGERCFPAVQEARRVCGPRSPASPARAGLRESLQPQCPQGSPPHLWGRRLRTDAPRAVTLQRPCSGDTGCPR